MPKCVEELSDPDPDKTYADYQMWRFDEMVELIRGQVFPLWPAFKSEPGLP
jgi:hypothetical protein